jgi:hypothetical protein
MTHFKKASAFLALILILYSSYCRGQFAPPAGQPGSTAIYADSSAFVNWAKTCVVTRGFVNIADTTVTYNQLNHASYGVDSDATGPPDDQVVSLGDGGSAVLTFQNPIANGPGPDFAVFENGLTDSFLELGFVEVSSDGIHFFRFPAISNTQDTAQIPSFGSIDATAINNFAGKYRVMYGTPFDLDTLKLVSGLDVNHITHVRIVDVVGCIQPAYATHDARGHTINDPWPTPFNSCGFDLDAVGVIHEGSQGINDKTENTMISVYPNPVKDQLILMNRESSAVAFTIVDPGGRTIMEGVLHTGRQQENFSQIPKGIYIGSFVSMDGRTVTVKIIKI